MGSTWGALIPNPMCMDDRFLQPFNLPMLSSLYLTSSYLDCPMVGHDKELFISKLFNLRIHLRVRMVVEGSR